MHYSRQRSSLLKLETRLVWIGCAASALTTEREWEQWKKAKNAGKDVQKEEERKKKEKEAEDSKAKVLISAPPSDKSNQYKN